MTAATTGEERCDEPAERMTGEHGHERRARERGLAAER